MNKLYHSIIPKANIAVFLLMLVFCSLASAATVTYTYDNLNRLNKVDYGNGAVIEYTYDAAGNRLSLVSVADTTPPTGTISINSSAASTKSKAVTLTLSCSDTGSGCAEMQFSIHRTGDTGSGATTWVNYSTIYELLLQSPESINGTYTITVRFKDGAGNVSLSYSASIVLDTTAPTTTASSAGGTYNSTQSVNLTCSDGTGSGCDKIYYTTDGSTPTTASTVYSTAISISATTTLKFFANDLAGNSEAVKTETYIISTNVDTTAPVFSSTAPASNSDINTATVGYTLSEAVTSGKITFTRTGGSTDSASHIYTFTDSDKTVGTHSVNTGLSLVNAGIYTVTFEATDLAGNAATVVSNTGVVYDNTSASVVINSPSSNSRTNIVSVSYTLNEEITSGGIVYTRTGGTADGLSPRKHTLGVSEKTAGSHTAGIGVTLIDGAIYTVGFENVTDRSGNATASVSNTNITYDSTAVAITNTTPASNGIITNSNVGYTLSEAALSGKVTFTRSGGSADSGSPHVYTVSGSDLYVGNHTVNSNLSLVDGTFYTVSFDATDMAGNPATTVSNAMVYYDTNYGIGPSGNADNSGYSINRVDGFDLIKLSIAFGSKPGDANWNPVCDLDKNGKVDGNDLVTLGKHFGEVQ